MVETENIINSMLINGITPDGLRQLIRTAVRVELDDFVKAIQQNPTPSLSAWMPLRCLVCHCLHLTNTADMASCIPAIVEAECVMRFQN